MKDGSEEKMMPLFWLHQLHAPSLVSIGQNKLKFLFFCPYLDVPSVLSSKIRHQHTNQLNIQSMFQEAVST